MAAALAERYATCQLACGQRQPCGALLYHSQRPCSHPQCRQRTHIEMALALSPRFDDFQASFAACAAELHREKGVELRLNEQLFCDLEQLIGTRMCTSACRHLCSCHACNDLCRVKAGVMRFIAGPDATNHGEAKTGIISTAFAYALGDFHVLCPGGSCDWIGGIRELIADLGADDTRAVPVDPALLAGCIDVDAHIPPGATKGDWELRGLQISTILIRGEWAKHLLVVAKPPASAAGSSETWSCIVAEDPTVDARPRFAFHPTAFSKHYYKKEFEKSFGALHYFVFLYYLRMRTVDAQYRVPFAEMLHLDSLHVHRIELVQEAVEHFEHGGKYTRDQRNLRGIMQSFESSCRRSASLEPIEKRLRRVQPPDQVFTGGGDSHRALNEAYSRQTRAIVETGHESVGHNTRVALRGVLREVARMRALAAAAGAFDEEQLAHAERDAANPNHSAEVRRLFEARAANLRRKQESLSSSSSSRHDAGGDVEDPLVDAMLRESAALLQCGPCAPCDER